MRPEGLCQRKIPMTPSGIEPATFPAGSALLQPTAPPTVMTPVTNIDKRYFIAKLIVPHLVKKFPEFNFPEGEFPCSQGPCTGFCPAPVESCPLPFIVLLQGPFILSFHYCSKWSFFLQVSPPDFRMRF
jgi:hypothetical protein